MRVSIFLNDNVLDYDLNAFQKDIIGFGKESDCDIPIGVDYISSLQGCFFRHESGWVIKDLGDVNGIIFNGEHITERMIMPGDTYELYNLEGAGVVRIGVMQPTYPEENTENGAPAKKGNKVLIGILIGLVVAMLAVSLVFFIKFGPIGNDKASSTDSTSAIDSTEDTSGSNVEDTIDDAADKVKDAEIEGIDDDTVDDIADTVKENAPENADEIIDDVKDKAGDLLENDK